MTRPLLQTDLFTDLNETEKRLSEVERRPFNGIVPVTTPAVAFDRRDEAFITSSLATNASENAALTIDKACEVYRVVTSRAARVRAYSSAAHRTADASRPVTEYPEGNHGVLLDLLTEASMLTVDLSPVVTFVNMDTTVSTNIYFAVQNLGSTGTVSVTLTVRRSE